MNCHQRATTSSRVVAPSFAATCGARKNRITARDERRCLRRVGAIPDGVRYGILIITRARALKLSFSPSLSFSPGKGGFPLKKRDLCLARGRARARFVLCEHLEVTKTTFCKKSRVFVRCSLLLFHKRFPIHRATVAFFFLCVSLSLSLSLFIYLTSLSFSFSI